jgi:hypothetical protein
LSAGPDHLEDEDEDDDAMQPMPRAGGVRAFSHLPVRDNPAPSSGSLREDSPRKGIAPIPSRSATPTSPAPTRLEDQDDPPLSEANPEDAPAPQDHADDRPWYMPRITAQDLPPQDHPEDAHAPAPKPWENTTRSSRFDAAPPADRSTSSTRSSGFFPSPQDLRDAFHSPAHGSPTGKDPAQDSRSALPRGRIFEKRLPPGFRDPGAVQFQSLADQGASHDLVHRFRGSPADAQSRLKDYSQPVADTRRAAPERLAARTEAFAHDEGQQQQQASGSGTTQSGTSVSRTSAVSPNADGSGVQFLNRVQPRDESAYNNNKPPVQRLENQGSSTRNKSPEQHKKEMDAFKQAQTNHEWNANSQTLKAWENFDRAVELMKRTPEGRAVWDRLNNDKGRSFQVMMVKSNGDENIYPELMRLGIRLRQGENGRYSYVTTVNGKEQHVILLLESAMSGHTLNPDGTINPDAESLEHVWHELYHASELHPSGGIDPLKVGTSSPTDWEKNPTQPDKAPTLHPQAHERRAVRFENIIRRRNGGTRVKKLYGGELKKNRDGTSSIVKQLKVTDPVPPRPPHLPPFQVVP